MPTPSASRGSPPGPQFLVGQARIARGHSVVDGQQRIGGANARKRGGAGRAGVWIAGSAVKASAISADGVAVDRTAVLEFLGYVQRRSTLMGVGAVAAIAAGTVGLVVAGGGAVAGWLGGLVVVGVVFAWASNRGMRLLREARSLPSTPQEMDLITWPYRGLRSPANNQVIVTLDAPGSKERTPLAEFKADWHSPGRLDIPTQTAQIFGTISRGQTVLALAEDGSCFLGRIRRTRAPGVQ